ncbi:hypothetical protein M9458_008036, partial [Cirrhinus mrigala]
AGHLGAANTTQRIRDRFHWPGLEAEVKRFCQACPTCQATAPRTPPPSPLIPLTIIEVPFERIGMDIVGPLPKSARGHEHILGIVDYATRYPEAVPLRKATAKNIAQELFLLASRVGIPTEILTDQGTPFMSRLMADLCRLLRVKQLRTTVYHPQTDGLVERFNQTLKQMLRRVVAEDKRDWDLMIPYVLFGIREVPQASTGVTPFKLLFGRQPRGLLDVAREAWQQHPAPHHTVIEHVCQMRERIDRVMPPNRCSNGSITGQPSSQPGQTNVVQHNIRTPPGVIVRQRPYRAIEEEVQQMLNPIVMVPKPDGTLRFCIDFRRLNEVSEFDGYPMPRVDELLDRLGSARYITTLDLTKGYWQVLLSETAKPKNCVLYPQWPLAIPDPPLRPPRGPRDVPEDDGHRLAAAYLDDVVVHSEAWEEHLDRLRRVLSELRRAGLNDNPRKCHLAFSEAKYLGFQVGRGLIRPQEKKVEAIHNAPRPQMKTQKGAAGEGMLDDHNGAFIRIKTALTSSPVLRAPDFSCPFLLQTDASDTGLGAVLSQIPTMRPYSGWPAPRTPTPG